MDQAMEFNEKFEAENAFFVLDSHFKYLWLGAPAHARSVVAYSAAISACEKVRAAGEAASASTRRPAKTFETFLQ